MSARSALLIAGTAALTACSPADGGEGSGTAAAAPNVVSLAATEYAVDAPDSIPAGWTTFRLENRGEEIHYGHIVQLEPGRTVEELVDAYREAIRTSGPRPRWVTRFGGPGGVAPGQLSQVTQFLEPGRYVWICPVEDGAGNPHFGVGEVKQFVVHASGPAAASQTAAPEASLEIRLLDHAFSLEGPLTAGRHTIRVENAGVEPHDVGLLRLAPGSTLDDVRGWLNPERGRRDEPASEPPPFESLGSGAGGVAAIAPGMVAFIETDLAPGEYVLFCMVTAPDGRSHIEHGMIRQISIR